MPSEKLQIVKMLLETDDKDILMKAKILLQSETTDPWDEWDDEVRKDVEEALKELDEGKGIPHKEVMREFSKWVKK